MGTDIHSRLEILHPEGFWECVTEEHFEGFFYDPSRPVSEYNRERTAEPLDDRNYRLFAMLADVRNGRGFGGVDTGDWVEPISQPRGIPFDASDGWLEYTEEWGGDLHSESYLTLAELEAYDWDGLVFERGYVSEVDYLAVRGSNSAPMGGYSGGISGWAIVTMTAMEYEGYTPEALERIRTTGSKDNGPAEIYVQHQWAETRRENMGELAEVIEVMRKIAPSRKIPGTEELIVDPERVRLMFGFDS